MNQGARLAAEIEAAFQLDSVERLSAMVRVRERLDAQIAVETAGFDGKAAFEGRSYRSPASFLVDACRISRSSASKYLNTGRALKSFPELTAAAKSGEISFDHVRAFARTVAPPRADEERVALASDAESEFLEKAKAYTADVFAGLCRAWRQIADEDSLDAQQRILEKTHVSYQDQCGDDTARLMICGPRVDVALIHKAISRITDELWRKENKDADSNVVPMRHRQERRFRAAVLMAKRAMARLAGEAVLPEPLVNVQMDWDTFDREATAYAAGEPGPGPNQVFRHGYLSQTSDGVPLSPGQAFHIGLKARIRRVVFGGRSRKVNLGRSDRLFTGGARDAIIQRDKHCQHPGCDMPAEWCDVDHILEWQHGGETNPENGQLLCRWHHTRKDAA